jgi:nucleoid-associated protein YgaU
MAVNFGQQVGPLPLGAWAAVVAGGLGIAWYSMRNQKAAAPAIVTDTSADPGVGTGPSWTAVGPPTTAPDTSESTIDTNEAWAVAAINYLIAQGYDPNVADSAIRKYIQSDSLSVQEYALVRFALAKLGSPPVPLPDPPTPPVVNPPVVPPPPPPPPPVPASTISMSGRYVWVTRTKPDNTLYGIAQHYYGNGNEWPTIWSHNYLGQTRPDGTKGEIWNPNLVYPGEKLWVP